MPMIYFGDNYRLRRIDMHNIVVEEYKPGGIPAKGALEGKISKSKWHIRGYFGRVEIALSYIMSRIVISGDEQDSIKSLQEKITRFMDEAKAKFAI